MINTIDINVLVEIAQAAGDAILEVYDTPFEVEYKENESPLTAADKASNAVILKGLQEHYPELPFISEETKQKDYEERGAWEYCWMIDPLDGTKEFIKRNGEFTVNIALIHKGEVVLGVIYVPVTGVTYYARKGEGSFKSTSKGADFQPISAIKAGAEDIVNIIVSRSHLKPKTEAYIEAQRQKYADVKMVPAGSSLKLCLVAEGTAHIYPRFGPSMEWDIAAGHIIAQEAGATVTALPEGNGTLQYNKEDLLNPFFIVEVNGQS